MHEIDTILMVIAAVLALALLIGGLRERKHSKRSYVIERQPDLVIERVNHKFILKEAK